MQKKLSKLIEKEIYKANYAKFIEGITFQQLKRISVEKDYRLN
ncbi:MAG: hypothetical protein QF436_04165 [Candidatus Woesearchaeota archaeon]|jgi:hypothetical protein|nr:hypothetical protein [Candidatus Woesearchaeota archaeon]MDP7623279.1 hypothetical protein [Candidatus Woesearchaeota archaeon]HJO02141.1 hypothetical protein [Candidatus Woesearchaeota archaeon]|tara:strand:+ start:24 stop:152 length:129 start_codon:yes stop_codon:yes gene_type:complete